MHPPRYDAGPGEGSFPGGRNVRLIYAYSIARSCLFVVPVLVPYFTLDVGLSFHQFILTEAAYAFALVLFEVPSGWLADHWQRKNTMVAGSVFWVLGMLGLWTADSFPMALVAQAVMGIGASMQSGTDSALLYDSLLVSGRQRRFLRYESRRQGLGLVTLAVVSAVSGLLFQISPHLVFALDTLALAVAGICAVFMVEPPRAKLQGHAINVVAMVRMIVGECRRNRAIFWLLLFAAGLLSTTKATVWLQQDYLQSLEVPVFWFGPVAAAGFFCGALASQLALVAERRLGATKSLGLVVGLLAAGFAAAGWFHSVWALPLLFLGSATWGMCGPMLNMLVQRQVTSDRRATMLSMLSLGYQLTFIPLAHGIGQIADHAGPGDGYVWLAVFVAVTAGLAWWGYQNQARRPAAHEAGAR